MHKVVHINFSDLIGGASRAAYRIHKGLLEQNVDSQMLVQKKESNEPEIITPYSSKMKKIIPILRPYVNSIVQKLQHTENPILHSSNVLPSGLHKMINSSDADIVHLHWINGEMISIKEIAKIKKPIVWTLHDMWVFSGAEHCDDLENSGRFKGGYTKENRPETYSKLDIDRWTWLRKKKHWQNIKFNFVTPSTWLANCLSESKLFKGQQATVIPNGLDTTVFKPTDKRIAREILNLPVSKKIVLYGAMGAESNPIKGYQKLTEAKKILYKNKDIQDVYFLVFGNDYRKTEQTEGFTTQYLGGIDDNITLSLVYSAADVMVVPSLMEAFGQTASEAMACGTPVVAFNATGLKDIVDHKKNGYLAEPYDSEDLARGIKWILENEKREKELGINARNKVENDFNIEKVSKQYISLYRKILGFRKNQIYN